MIEIFLKVSAGVLITAVLSLVISGRSKDISLLLSIFVCCISLLAVASYLKPVLDFAQKLVTIGNLDDGYLQLLCKVVGIGLISHVSVLICQDSGNQTLAKVLQIVTTMVLLCMCVPLLEEILMLIQKILGEL